jgi:hypothetical protein
MGHEEQSGPRVGGHHVRDRRTCRVCGKPPPPRRADGGTAGLHRRVRGRRIPAVADHNVPRAHGDGPIPFNLIDGVRQSTALTHLAVARKRPNLTVRGGVLVERYC